jgi:hypothetical protein
MSRSALWATAYATAFASALSLPACTSRSSEAAQAARARIWGKDDPPPEIMKRAQQTIAAGEASDPAVRDRILGMPFEELVARLGIVEYRGLARFVVSRNEERLTVVEDTTIRQGLHGSFQVLQRNEEGTELRQGVYDNGVFYFSTGGGELRVEGMVHDRARQLREEVFEPLRAFAGLFGPRLGLAAPRPVDHELRRALRYELVLVEGDALVPGKDGDGPKRPKRLRGFVVVDEATGAPVKGELDGELEAPPPAGRDVAPGKIEVSLQFSTKLVGEGAAEEIKPKKFVDTIVRHPMEKNPLGFLDGGTRTATIIGGRRAPAPSAAQQNTADDDDGEER